MVNLELDADAPSWSCEGELHILETVDYGDREGKCGQEPHDYSYNNCFGNNAFRLKTFFSEMERCVETRKHELRGGKTRQERDTIWPAARSIGKLCPDVCGVDLDGGASGAGNCYGEKSGY